MKIITMLCIGLFPLAVAAQDTFEIAGTLSAVSTGRTILLQYKNKEGNDAMDSTVVRNGKFILRGNTAFSDKATISLLPAGQEPDKNRTMRDAQVFFLEKGRYQLHGTNSIAQATLTGTPSQQEYLEYIHQQEGLRPAYDTLEKKFNKAYAANDSIEIEKIRNGLIAAGKQANAIRDAFIFSHPDSYVTLNLVVHEVSPIQHPRYYEVLSKRMLASAAGQKLKSNMEKSRLIALGKSIDFTQPDAQGKPFQLSSLRGQYVLVDFWASWCGPCRGETPYLQRAYRTLKNRHFEIVSISLDDTKAAWLKAVADDRMSWIQVSDLKGVKNEVATRYGMTSIPQNVLVNPEGVIIAKNLRGEDVTEQLSALIQ